MHSCGSAFAACSVGDRIFMIAFELNRKTLELDNSLSASDHRPEHSQRSQRHTMVQGVAQNIPEESQFRPVAPQCSPALPELRLPAAPEGTPPLQCAALWLAQADRVAVLTGAGVSVAS